MVKSSTLMHLAISVDGNRRWSERHGKSISEGYERAINNFSTCIDFALKIGIPFLSFHVFNESNLQRPQAEINIIMEKITSLGRIIANYSAEKSLSTTWLGEEYRMPSSVIESLKFAESSSVENPELRIALYVNYNCKAHIEKDLYKSHRFPDFDLYVRPTLEYRISGFDLSRIAFSELLFIDVGFPSLKEEHLEKCASSYYSRNRTLGK